MPEPHVHIVIPDCQVKPGVRTDHLGWISQYIVDRYAGRENVTIVHLGDFWDMPSLSSWDKGKKAMEGRRYIADIQAGNDGFNLLNSALKEYNSKRKTKWEPRRIFLLGNHEDRITRAAESNAQLDGLVSLNDLNITENGWEIHPFLKPVEVDGILYAHYFYVPMTGRAYSGTMDNRLKSVGQSFAMGHQQTLMYGLRFVNGRSQHGLVAGACYQHDEDYKGPQGNAHWRGIIVCHQVERGSYDPMFISLEYLCRRYTGKTLAQLKWRK